MLAGRNGKPLAIRRVTNRFDARAKANQPFLKLPICDAKNKSLMKTSHGDLFAIFRKIDGCDGRGLNVDWRFSRRESRPHRLSIVNGTGIDPTPNDVDFGFR